MNVSDENAAKLQREIDVNGDGIVSIPEVTDWWRKKQEKMNEKLYKDPTAEWGNAPGTTSREVSGLGKKTPRETTGCLFVLVCLTAAELPIRAYRPESHFL